MNKIITFIITIFLAFQVNTRLFAQDPIKIAKLEKQLQSNPSRDTNRIDILLSLYEEYNIKSYNPSVAQKYIDECYEIAKEVNNPIKLVFVLEYVAHAAYQEQKLSKSLIILKERLELCRVNNFTTHELTSLINIGNAYIGIGSNSTAEKYFNEAYLVSKKTKKPDDIAYTLNNLAFQQGLIGNHEGAITSIYEALKYKKGVQKMELIQESYLLLGNAYSSMNELKNAREAYDSSQATINRYNLGEMQQYSLDHVLGDFYLNKLHDPKTAIKLQNKIILGAQVIMKGGMCEIYNSLANAYLKDNQPAEAFKYALLSKKLADTLQEVELGIIRESYKCMASAKSKLNEWKEAYEYKDIADNLADSISQKREKELSTFAMVGHEIESNERELIEKNNKIEQQKRIYEIIGILAIPILLLLAGLVYSRIKILRNKERIETQLAYSNTLEQKIAERTLELEHAHKLIQESKDRENMSLALLNQKHMTLLEDLTEKLESWENSSSATNAKEIRPALHEIKAAQAQAEEWGTFMLHFERIHPDFAKKIQEICPSISSNEVKHCAYMKLGLARKEVADTLKCSENAVKQSRNRIRRKLNLLAEDSLQEFLNTL